MKQRKLLLGLLALSLAAPGAYAQTAATTAPAAPAASLAYPASVQALKDMGARLQTLKRFRVTTELRDERVLFFDGKTVTLYLPAQKGFSTVELHDTLAGLVEKLENRFGIEVPLSDLFVWSTPAVPLGKIESAMNAGQDFIGDDLCNTMRSVRASLTGRSGSPAAPSHCRATW